MIDYLTVMLLNLCAGIFVLVFFMLQLKNLDEKKLKHYIPVFLMIGFTGTVTGLHMIFTWPLIGSYNIPYGEMSLLFGILFLGAALTLGKEWSFFPLTIYAVFAGAAAILLGLRILNLKLTPHPMMSTLGFILVGVAGILITPAYLLRKNRTLAIVCAVILTVAGIIWILTTYGSYWAHMKSFAEWIPIPMR